jgi:hypothetical protein
VAYGGNIVRIKKTNTKVTTIFAVVFFCIALCTPAFSQGNIHLGPLEMHPSFWERIESDDNVFQTSGKGGEKKRSDLINIYSPGLELLLPLGGGHAPGKESEKRNKLSLDWYSDFKNYKNHAAQNQQNHYFTGSVEFRFPRGFSIALDDSYTDTESPASSETDKLHPRKTNTGSITISSPRYFRRLINIEFKYTNFDQDYEEIELIRANRNVDTFTVKIPYKFTNKITLFPMFVYGETEYDENILSDSSFTAIFGGGEWYATAKTTGTFRYGLKSVDYDRPEVSDVKTLVLMAGVQVDFSERTILNLNLSRNINESEFTTGSNSYVSTRGSFSLSRRMTRKLTATLSGGYTKDVFSNSPKKNDIYEAGFSAVYKMKEWFSANFEYSYKDKNSNIDTQSNLINKVSFGIGVNF